MGFARNILTILSGVLLIACAAPGASLDQWFSARRDAIRSKLDNDHDYASAAAAFDGVFGQIVLYALEDNSRTLIDAAVERRVFQALAKLPNNVARQQSLHFAIGNGKFRQTLALLLCDADGGDGLAGAVIALRAKFGQAVDALPNVAAAICVVHDQPLRMRINENNASADGVEALFAYFFQNRRRMPMGLDRMPPELLIYVVDASASTKELEWALSKYSRETQMGRLYRSVPYDYNSFFTGSTKKLTTTGFNLPNILKCGGICADQAYFASTVGKAIGIPTAYVVGRGSDFSHAWVGYLEALPNGKAAWNFNEGRYTEYQRVRGQLVDPQTREEVPDGYVALLAELVSVKEEDRWLSTALTDASAWLASGAKSPAPPENVSVLPPRARDPSSQLAILQRAVELNPANRQAWKGMCALASEGKMSLDQKRQWSDAILKLCGNKYPDFAFDRLVPLIESISDTPQQIQIWESALTLFKDRPDLLAAIRVQQGQCFEAGRDYEKAGTYYFEVVQKYANDGPFVIDALLKAENVLAQMKRQKQIVPLYQQAWSKIARPPRTIPEYFAGGTWYQVGDMLVGKLNLDGRKADANKVRAMLEAAKSR